MSEKWTTPGDVNRKYKRWLKQMKSILYQCFKRVTTKQDNSSTNTTLLIKDKTRLKKKVKFLNNHGLKESHSTQLLNMQIEEIINKISQSIADDKASKLSKRLKHIMNEGQGKTNEIWNIRKRALGGDNQRIAIKDKEGNQLTCKENIMKRYTEYFHDLLQPRPIQPQNEELTKEVEKQFFHNLNSMVFEEDEINKPFKMEEVTREIRSLKNNKCPGPDEITNEILKNSGKSLVQNILNFINWMWEHETVPDTLKALDIKTIYKGKGCIADMANYRGIFIGNAILKLKEKLINSRSTPRIEQYGFSEAQAGGRKNRNITDHLFIIRSLMDHYKYLNKPLFILFLDLVKAFDKMVLKNIMNDLWKSNVRGKIWRVIYTINKQATIRIKTNFGKTDPVQIGETLKQGSVLASTLAAMHTDKVDGYFKNSGLGVYYGNKQIGNLIFQDDIARRENS